MRKSPMERFIEKLRYDEETGCYLWLGYCDPKGYAIFYTGGKSHRASRWYQEQVNGVIPTGLEISHVCDTPGCVRIHPEHAILETHADNIRRVNYDQIRGEKNGNAKLDAFDVALIRTISKNRKTFPPEHLARIFNVCMRTIYYLLAYETYRDITLDQFSRILAGGEAKS